MKIHPSGFFIIFISTVLLIIINVIIYFLNNSTLSEAVLLFSIALNLLLIWFFRVPNRQVVLDRDAVISPCDGKIILIQQTEEKKYLKDKCLQISIFMSPLNVHVNWYPVSGFIILSKHFKGKYLAAFKPKSSLLNERHYTLIYTLEGYPILMKQVAGALARKIINYAIRGQKALQSKEIGFIKFGSRIDLFLPINCKILVQKGQLVKGSQTKLAIFLKK